MLQIEWLLLVCFLSYSLKKITELCSVKRRWIFKTDLHSLVNCYFWLGWRGDFSRWYFESSPLAQAAGTWNWVSYQGYDKDSARVSCCFSASALIRAQVSLILETLCLLYFFANNGHSLPTWLEIPEKTYIRPFYLIPLENPLVSNSLLCWLVSKFSCIDPNVESTLQDKVQPSGLPVQAIHCHFCISVETWWMVEPIYSREET